MQPANLTSAEEDEGMYISGHCGGSKLHQNCRGVYAFTQCGCTCHARDFLEPTTTPEIEPVAVVETLHSPVFRPGSSVVVTFANGMSRTLRNVSALTDTEIHYGTSGRTIAYTSADTVEILV